MSVSIWGWCNHTKPFEPKIKNGFERFVNPWRWMPTRWLQERSQFSDPLDKHQRALRGWGLRVEALGLRAEGFNPQRIEVQGVGCRVQGVGCRMEGSGCRGSSHIRNCHSLGPYSSPLPRALRWSLGGTHFLMSEAPLQGGLEGLGCGVETALGLKLISLTFASLNSRLESNNEREKRGVVTSGDLVDCLRVIEDLIPFCR